MDTRFINLKWGEVLLKITTLIENKEGDTSKLDTEHGISLYIEVDNKKILFDTGQSGNFVKNAKKLNIDLNDIDYVILSHGHYDHSGGFEKLVKEFSTDFKLFVGKGFFDKKYSISAGEYMYNGNFFDINFIKDHHIDIEYIGEDIRNISEKIMIMTNFQRDPNYENINQTMYIKKGEDYILDEFKDEISLVVDTEKGLVVVVGCSHPGIVNILETIKNRIGKDIYMLIGGTHLIKEDDEKINSVIEYLKENEIKRIAACHCTGKQGETMLDQQMKEAFKYNATGDELRMV